VLLGKDVQAAPEAANAATAVTTATRAFRFKELMRRDLRDEVRPAKAQAVAQTDDTPHFGVTNS
jgi:hypothetical protein